MVILARARPAAFNVSSELKRRKKGKTIDRILTRTAVLGGRSKQMGSYSDILNVPMRGIRTMQDYPINLLSVLLSHPLYASYLPSLSFAPPSSPFLSPTYLSTISSPSPPPTIQPPLAQVGLPLPLPP